MDEGLMEKRAVYRILDAAANRGREGLRVVEDFVRFSLNDERLTAALKEFRHGLRDCLAALKLEDQVECRETAADVGTGITLNSEQSRSGVTDVLQANTRRVGEALRTLEEYSKVIDPQVACGLEALRYRFYDLERDLWTWARGTTGAARRRALAECTLYALISARDCQLSLAETVRGAAAGGVGAFQFRDKSLDDRSLLQQALELRQLTRETDSLLIINDRPDIALLSQADGVHVGQEELPIAEVRRLVGRDMLVGVSTHSLAQARQAVQEGADYLGVGPVFPSETKAFAEFVGVDLPRAVAAEIRIPWFAIGGIRPENGALLAEVGVSRIAVTRAVCGHAEPESQAKKFLKIFSPPGTNSAAPTS